MQSSRRHETADLRFEGLVESASRPGVEMALYQIMDFVLDRTMMICGRARV